MFNVLLDATNWLESQIKFKPKTDLVRMRAAYKLLDVDLNGIKKIHVAGTNGKGSVCSYMSYILIEAGYKVGTYTSPYLVRFNERIRVQMKEINDQDLLDQINFIYQFNNQFHQSYGETLSFFELLTLMSMRHFYQSKVDVMIIEVGLGGLLDATNILNYDLSLITSIGFDHMKQLGNTLESIASNKLGILKKGNHLITTVDETLHPYFDKYLENNDVTYHFLTKKDIHLLSENPIRYTYDQKIYTIPLVGSYQILNSLLSIEGIRYLYPSISYDIIDRGIQKTTWYGRLEMIDTNIYIDGAHNIHAMDALVETAKTTFRDKDIWILFSALGDKDILGMIKRIKTFAKRVVFTSFPDPRFVDLSPYIGDDIYLDDPHQAILELKRQMTDHVILIITGSLHFIGYIKKTYDEHLVNTFLSKKQD
ncbi:MAG: folylpolyglutamate synthase/dihydrofolate synthase family protein [Acholeplasmataceae bacterium]